MQNVVTGDANAGQAFFSSHCTSCHSAAGDLAHVASKYEPVALQSQFLYPASSTKPRTATVTLPDGKAASGMVKQVDDFDITLQNDDGTSVVYDRSSAKVEIHDPLDGHRKLLDVYTDSDMHNVLTYLVTLK